MLYICLIIVNETLSLENLNSIVFSKYKNQYASYM